MWWLQEVEKLKLRHIDEALVNISVDDLADALTLLMEVGREGGRGQHTP